MIDEKQLIGRLMKYKTSTEIDLFMEIAVQLRKHPEVVYEITIQLEGMLRETKDIGVVITAFLAYGIAVGYEQAKEEELESWGAKNATS